MSTVIAIFNDNTVDFDFSNGQFNTSWMNATAQLVFDPLYNGIFDFSMALFADDVSIEDVNAKVFYDDSSKIIHILDFKGSYYDIVPHGDKFLTIHNIQDFHLLDDIMEVLYKTLLCKFQLATEIVFHKPDPFSLISQNPHIMQAIDVGCSDCTDIIKNKLAILILT